MWSLPQQPTFINKFCTRGLFYSPFPPYSLRVSLLCCSPCWCSCFFLFLLSLQLEHTAIMHKTQEGTHSSYLYTRTMHNFVVCATSSLALQNRNYACLCLDRLRRVPPTSPPPTLPYYNSSRSLIICKYLSYSSSTARKFSFIFPSMFGQLICATPPDGFSSGRINCASKFYV